MKRLIVNADDLGWSEAVTSGILKAYREGIVTSATLMANLPGAAETLERARAEAPRLAVGLHLTLTEGDPLAPPSEVGPILDEAGHLQRSLRWLFRAARRSAAVRRAIVQELAAQAAWAGDHGFAPSHLDSHKHVHLHPSILPEVVALARRHGVRAVRTAAEIRLPHVGRLLPAGWGLGHRTAQWLRARLVRRWGLWAQSAVRREGLVTTDWFFGVRATGGVSARLLIRLLEAAPDGTGEVMVHPGLAEERSARPTRLADSRPLELQAVCDSEVRRALQAHGWGLTNYAEMSQ